MRILYFILYCFLPYSLRLYYPRIRITRNPKHYLGRTIYVSNHAASFMDPLIIASKTRPIVFFMTRSDVFTSFMKPILWAAHMLPIYRQQDGMDTKRENEKVFVKCAKILKQGRNLLIFGEGFTDDVFVRRLKPLKKGALRIGFDTLDYIGWDKKIYIATVGVNYGNPNVIGSEVIISNSEHICLNDYEKEYKENPHQVVNHLLKRLEIDLKQQLTHVEEYNWAFFHEYVTRIKRMGIDPFDRNLSIPLLQRWENSKSFANWINQQNLNDEHLISLKNDLDTYFKQLKRLRIHDREVFEVAEKKQNITLKWFRLILLFPLTILGYLHNFIPYILIKKFVEKSFRRRVFWSSVKMMLGVVAIGCWNVLVVILMHLFIFKPLLIESTSYVWLISFFYFMITPIFGAVAYYNHRVFVNIRIHKKLSKKLSALVKIREELLKRVNGLSYFTSIK